MVRSRSPVRFWPLAHEVDKICSCGISKMLEPNKKMIMQFLQIVLVSVIISITGVIITSIYFFLLKSFTEVKKYFCEIVLMISCIILFLSNIVFTCIWFAQGANNTWSFGNFVICFYVATELPSSYSKWFRVNSEKQIL
jgi:hypothetical protein